MQRATLPIETDVHPAGFPPVVEILPAVIEVLSLSAQKFNTRYVTFGFNDSADLDDGNVWPVAYAPSELTAADEKRILALVKKAMS